MSPWGSRWLEHEMTYDNLQDDELSDARNQRTSASCRPHGPRWYNFVQGIRRSLDVHLKSYYKIDNAFTSALRPSSASSKLQALCRGLTDTGLIDFCCVYLVHPVRGTFGIVALSGAGAELFPPLLSEGQQAAQLNTRRDNEQGSCRLLPNIFTRCIFQVQDSNWSVEDVVASRAPWYYDCTAATNGFGLPTDGGWLRRAGLRSVLALPAMGPGGDVTGVLAVATKQKTLDHLLLRKLEDLCYKLAPIVGDAVEQHVHLLANRRLAAPYESIADFAHEVLGELLNLDRAVAVSVCKTGNANGATTGVNPSQQRQHQRQASITAAAAGSAGSGKGRKSRKSDSGQFDAAAAVAAAAAAATAAGFTWIGAPPAQASMHGALTHAPLQPAQIGAQSGQQGQQVSQGIPQRVSPFAENQPPLQHQQQTNSTFRSALTSVATQPNSVLALVSTTDDLVTSPQASSVDETAIILPADADARQPADIVQRSCPCPSVGPMHKHPQSQTLWTAPGVSLAESLPAPGTIAAEGNTMVELILGAGGPPAASSGDRVASRSTRSLSCLEFSSGVAASEVREALAESGGMPAAEVRKALACQEAVWTASALMDSSCSSRSGSPCRGPVSAERWQRQSPVRTVQQPQDIQTSEGAAAGDMGLHMQGAFRTVRVSAMAKGAPNSAASSARSSGEGLYMMDSRNADELAQSPLAGYVMSPSSSTRTVKGGAGYLRGIPLESSVGRAAVATGVSAGETPAPSYGNRRGASSSAIWTVSAARGSSCATDVSAGMDTTFGGTLTARTSTGCTNKLCHLSSVVTPSASAVAAWQSEVDRGLPDVIVRDLSETRWSRDSAAAAAAVWSNEAADAFAAAMRFTAAAEMVASVQSGARMVPRSCTGAGASQQAGATTAAFCYGGDSLLGGLYDIQESGSVPVPSHVSSMDSLVDGEADCSVELSGWPAGGEAGAFLLSSGLGAEALERCKQQY